MFSYNMINHIPAVNESGIPRDNHMIKLNSLRSLFDLRLFSLIM
jgi:hypothetical protein